MARVLVIDDEINICKSLHLALEADGHEVTEAYDGVSGIELMHEKPADIVIVDIFMPEQDGIVTIKEIRRCFPDAKIIAISGGGSQGRTSSLKVAKYLGAHFIFSKPFDTEELLDAIRELSV